MSHAGGGGSGREINENDVFVDNSELTMHLQGGGDAVSAGGVVQNHESMTGQEEDVDMHNMKKNRGCAPAGGSSSTSHPTTQAGVAAGPRTHGQHCMSWADKFWQKLTRGRSTRINRAECIQKFLERQLETEDFQAKLYLC